LWEKKERKKKKVKEKKFYEEIFENFKEKDGIC
jgi:hypothetical protein